MSSTTTNSSSTMSTGISFTAGATAISNLPTKGSTFGALYYNLNSMLGWRLGTPSASDVYLYSDLCFNNAGGFIDVADPSTVLFVTNDPNYSDQTLVQVASQNMTYGDEVLTSTSLTPDQYSTKFGSSDGIFGMSFLPWNPTGVLGSDGNYHCKVYYSTWDYVQCNPMRRANLMIKLFTILKIFGISVGSYFLIKLLYDISKRKQA